MTIRRIAILIDAGFFLKRLPHLVARHRCDTPEAIVKSVRHLCARHVMRLTGCEYRDWNQYVYRIFYYDAKPYDGKAHNPIDNRSIDYAKSDLAAQRRAIFDGLRRQRKVALRLGKVNRESDWVINPRLTKKVLRTRNLTALMERMLDAADTKGDIQLTLSEQERQDLAAVSQTWQQMDTGSVRLGLRQKGVDMRIGTDIASLVLKQQADTIVLVSGDSDFVPAAKLARREGIDFILDPLWQQINADLYEHIDGLQSGFRRPGENDDDD